MLVSGRVYPPTKIQDKHLQILCWETIYPPKTNGWIPMFDSFGKGNSFQIEAFLVSMLNFWGWILSLLGWHQFWDEQQQQNPWLTWSMKSWLVRNGIPTMAYQIISEYKVTERDVIPYIHKYAGSSGHRPAAILVCSACILLSFGDFSAHFPNQTSNMWFLLYLDDHPS